MFPLAPQQLLRLSSQLLLSGLGLLLLGLLAAYGLESRLNLASLVLAHSLTIVGPGLLKLGYVLRLAAQNGLRAREGGGATA
jgi:hypothetical protein